MKVTLVLATFSAIFFLLLVSIKINGAEKTETQKYTTLVKEGDFEIRFYPDAIMASVKMEGTYDEMKGKGFRALAGYIFGGNEQGMSIAMISPVRVSDGNNGSEMSFVMPPAYSMEELPNPTNSQVVIHQLAPAYAASISFGGYANDKKIEAKKKELVSWLTERGLNYSAEVEFLGYIPPYQFINRRNEVMIKLVGYKP